VFSLENSNLQKWLKFRKQSKTWKYRKILDTATPMICMKPRWAFHGFIHVMDFCVVVFNETFQNFQSFWDQVRRGWNRCERHLKTRSWYCGPLAGQQQRRSKRHQLFGL